jgi:hypothetical protein
MLFDPGVLHQCSLAKYAAAFLTGRVPLLIGRFPSSNACVIVKVFISSHGFGLFLGLTIFINPGMQGIGINP